MKNFNWKITNEKWYKNTEDQIAAGKRWLEKNPENRMQKARNTRNSAIRKSIREDVTSEEIELIKSWIEEREKELTESIKDNV